MTDLLSFAPVHTDKRASARPHPQRSSTRPQRFSLTISDAAKLGSSLLSSSWLTLLVWLVPLITLIMLILPQLLVVYDDRVEHIGVLEQERDHDHQSACASRLHEEVVPRR